MLRRAAIALFAAAALLVVACGHQVTPSPTAANNNLAGHVVIKFRVNGTLDFNDFTYAIVIDTCGNGTPYPQAYLTTFNSFSYGFFVGLEVRNGAPQLVEYFVNPNSNGSIQYVTVPEDPSLEQFLPNDNGQGNEFELIFDRAELDNPLDQAQPCPNFTASPSTPTPSPSSGVTPTATPTTITFATGAASPAASATPSPSSFPTQPSQQYWYLNFFTISNNTILDSLGIGGATDQTFNGVGFDVNVTSDYPIFKANGGPEPSNPSAQLSGGDVQNYM
jgi:hypothetical protein